MVILKFLFQTSLILSSEIGQLDLFVGFRKMFLLSSEAFSALSDWLEFKKALIVMFVQF